MSLSHTHTHTQTLNFLPFIREERKMGVNSSKHRRGGLCEKNVKVLKMKNKKKMRFVQEEGGSERAMYERVRGGERRRNNNNDSASSGTIDTTTTYEREMMAFAFKKAEWKQERKKLKEEVKVVRAWVEEKEEMIREMREEAEAKGRERGGGENKAQLGKDGDEKEGVVFGKEWGVLGPHDHLVLVEQMRAERARRDETVEKWKQLYLAIKMELDDLIQRTHEGGLYWRAEEEDIAEEQKNKLKAKEETIKELRSKLASMEQEMVKKDREVDILRQSLRIMSSKKVLHPKNPPKKVLLAKQAGKM